VNTPTPQEPLRWSDAGVMITGGTGSFGNKLVEIMLTARFDHPSVRYFIGDVRDRARLEMAMHGVDIVFHAAALKQITACEYNPFEAIQTNVMGAKNVIDAAIDQGVKRVVGISTDKAAQPVNLYGATKLCAEKLLVQGNVYGWGRGTTFSVVRYGNVIGSRGSVIPLFSRQRATGRVTVTDPGMTRFWITLEQGVRFAVRCAEAMQGCQVELIGMRPGEKLHEILIAEDEGRQVLEFEDMFVLEPIHRSWTFCSPDGGKRLTAGFRYSSDTNSRWLSPSQMSELARE